MAKDKNPVMASMEATKLAASPTGFLSFAIATGLIYGRFSKPKANLKFSDHALITPFKEKTALMFRFASFKNNHTLTDVDAVVTLGMQVQENEKPTYKFYQLPLERKHVDSLPMNWTVVHPIDEESPLWGFNFEDMKTADVELYILIRAFDDVYSNIVLQRTSYTYEEIKFNAKFVVMSKQSDDGNTTILEFNKLNQYVEL